MAECVNLFKYASTQRRPNELWKETVKRVAREIKMNDKIKICLPPKGKGKRKQHKYKGKTKSECHGLPETECKDPCHWIKESTTKTGETRKAHCGLKRIGSKKATSISQVLEKTYSELYREDVGQKY